MEEIARLFNDVDRIIIKLEAMREDAYYEHGSWLLKHEPKATNVFSLFDKYTTVAIELLLHYEKVWKDDSERPSRHDMEERVKIVIGSCFTSCLSVVEYFMKDCLRRMQGGPLQRWHNDKLRNLKKRKGGYIGLRAILLISKDKGLISQSDHESWTGARLLRNALVHNNGIADFSKEWDIDGTTVKFREGKPIRHKLWAHSAIVASICRLTRKWTESFLELHPFL